MRVWERPDGLIAVDFGPPDGPFITLTRKRWNELVGWILSEHAKGDRS